MKKYSPLRRARRALRPETLEAPTALGPGPAEPGAGRRGVLDRVPDGRVGRVGVRRVRPADHRRVAKLQRL